MLFPKRRKNVLASLSTTRYIDASVCACAQQKQHQHQHHHYRWPCVCVHPRCMFGFLKSFVFFLLVLWFVISTTVGIHRIVQEYIREMKLRVHVYVYMIDACLLLVLNCIRVWLAVSNTSTDFVDNTSNTQSHFTVNKI